MAISEAVSLRPAVDLAAAIFSLALLLTATTSAAPAISYAEHCADAVPEAMPTSDAAVPSGSFVISGGYFAGGRLPSGEPLLPLDPYSAATPSFSLRPRSIFRTSVPGVLWIDATLSFRDGRFGLGRPIGAGRNFSDAAAVGFRRRRIDRRGGVSFFHRPALRFDLSGAWSESSGRLCMVGAGTRSGGNNSAALQFSAVFNLRYPNSSTISTSVVAGTIESLDSPGSSSHFDPIHVLAYSQMNYEFTRISDANESCGAVPATAAVASCSLLQSYSGGNFHLGYSGDCGGKDGGNSLGCSPSATSFLPTVVNLKQIDCSGPANGELLHMILSFPNSSDGYYRGDVFVPERSMVAEGFWDGGKNRLCAVACWVLDLGDCSVRLCLWFPSSFSIDSRSSVAGRLWSSKTEGEAGYFREVSLRSSGIGRRDGDGSGSIYEYTKLGGVDPSCLNSSATRISDERRFVPDGRSPADMRFRLSLNDPERSWASGFASPFSVGESLYLGDDGAAMDRRSSNGTLKVNYEISLPISMANFSGVGRALAISAEGFYNSRTGRLCMVGCRSVGPPWSETTDCEIAIAVELRSSGPEEDGGGGTIRSTRRESDPLHFEALEVLTSSMSESQAARSVWRMDVEVALVLVSLTLSVVFVGAQLLHVRRSPGVLPSMSLTMLLVLTLGYMVPLVLNFEAMFAKVDPGKQNVVLWSSGGWLEANEVVVRVVTMVAFLMQFRLLLAANSARSSEDGAGDRSKKARLFAAERKTLQLCLPLYFVGALLAWFFHTDSGARRGGGGGLSDRLLPGRLRRRSIWDDLTSYAGLILDCFLFPQVFVNAAMGSKEEVLSPTFYVGTTAVRALPHLYDLYRARHFLPLSMSSSSLSSSYIYANPNGDVYSVAWDIIIPVAEALLAVLIFLQQRFGGGCLVPERFRKNAVAYETVPAADAGGSPER